MDIAIVGTGVAGLAAAHYLHRYHRVTLLEAGAYVGGHTHTIPLTLAGRPYAIDTGFIVFNQQHYPRFSALLGELGVPTRPTTMSFSVRCDTTGLEYNATSLGTLFVQRRNLVAPGFHRMLLDILRFHRQAPRVLDDTAEAVSVAQWVARHRYSQRFIRDYLTPLGACLWSCPTGTFARFPMRFVVEFMANHAMLQAAGRPVWRTVCGGSARYVEKLAAPFAQRIRLHCPVQAVRRQGGAVTVYSPAGPERFDHVVLACHADQALAMLSDPSPLEQRVLASFPYQLNEVTLHTDTSVLPRNPKAWASWNARLHAGEGRFTATYNMNLLQGLDAPQTFCVTLNGEDTVDPSQVLGRYRYHHPIFTPGPNGRLAAQKRHPELINHRATSYCGAYWGYGFHEDAVRSAGRVARVLLEGQRPAAPGEPGAPAEVAA